jgi:hypothetical protein
MPGRVLPGAYTLTVLPSKFATYKFPTLSTVIADGALMPFVITRLGVAFGTLL